MAESIETHLSIASECVCCNGRDLKRSPAILMPFVAERAFGWTPVEITADWGLRDVRRGNAYPLCNSVRCCRCGLLFLDIRFGDRELNALYADYRGKAYTQLRQKYEPNYSARNEVLLSGYTYIPIVEEFLSKHVPAESRILDWGGDTGLNTPLKAGAREHHVYDISNKAVMPGVVKVTLDEAAHNHYDLIVLSEVLEHVPYPQHTLRGIVRVMKPGTLLYIEVPQEQLQRSRPPDAPLETLKKHWHEHINFFSERSLQELLSACNLRMTAFANLNIPVEGNSVWIFSIICTVNS